MPTTIAQHVSREITPLVATLETEIDMLQTQVDVLLADLQMKLEDLKTGRQILSTVGVSVENGNGSTNGKTKYRDFPRDNIRVLESMDVFKRQRKNSWFSSGIVKTVLPYGTGAWASAAAFYLTQDGVLETNGLEGNKRKYRRVV